MLISKIRKLRRTENPAPSHTAKGQVLGRSCPRSLEGDARSAGSWRPGRHRKREEELSRKPSMDEHRERRNHWDAIVGVGLGQGKEAFGSMLGLRS